MNNLLVNFYNSTSADMFEVRVTSIDPDLSLNTIIFPLLLRIKVPRLTLVTTFHTSSFHLPSLLLWTLYLSTLDTTK